MEVLLESEEQMGRNKQKRNAKRQRPDGPPVPSPAAAADQTGRLLAEGEHEWLERLTTDPASFAAVEREVHESDNSQLSIDEPNGFLFFALLPCFTPLVLPSADDRCTSN